MTATELQRKEKEIAFLELWLSWEENQEAIEAVKEMLAATRSAIGTINAVNERKDDEKN